MKKLITQLSEMIAHQLENGLYEVTNIKTHSVELQFDGIKLWFALYDQKILETFGNFKFEPTQLMYDVLKNKTQIIKRELLEKEMKLLKAKIEQYGN